MSAETARVRAGHRAGDPRPAQDADEDVLRLRAVVRRPAEHPHLPGLPGAARARCPCVNERAVALRAHDRPGARVRDRRALAVPPQELLLSRPAQGLPDLPVRRAAVPAAAGSATSASTACTSRRTPPSSNHLGESGRIHGSDRSVVDFNRGGTPLVEIVTEPDLRSRRAGARVADAAARRRCGSSASPTSTWRRARCACDANVSVRPAGTTELGTKTELKNMNSFRFLERGVKAEIERQIGLLEAGEPVVQETLHFDPATRHADAAALQGGGARLPLLPRARPGAAAGHRGDDGGRARRAARSCPPHAPQRFEQRARAQRRTRARLLAFRTRARRLLRAALAAAADGQQRRTRRAVQLDPAAGRADRLGRRPGATASVTPEALAALAAMVDAKEVSRDAGTRGADRCSSQRGRRPARDRRARGARRDQRRRRRSRPRSSTSAIAADPDAAEKVRGGQHEGDRPAGRLRDARDQGTRRRRRGHAADPRALRRRPSGCARRELRSRSRRRGAVGRTNPPHQSSDAAAGHRAGRCRDR